MPKEKQLRTVGFEYNATGLVRHIFLDIGKGKYQNPWEFANPMNCWSTRRPIHIVSKDNFASTNPEQVISTDNKALGFCLLYMLYNSN